jgi:hypothetical protein
MTPAEQFLAAYAGVEPWKANHDAAIRCFEVEDRIALGILAYQVVTYVDAAWQERVAEGKLRFEEENDRRIGKLYRTWVEISERNLAAVEELIRDGFEVKGADEFLARLEEARSLLESRDLESEMRPIEKIQTLERGNPRPERY